MAKYYLQYTIYDKGREPITKQTTTIGGVEVISQGSSTVSGGFNYYRLVGVTPASQLEDFSQFGFSSDEVGTTYYRYGSIDIPDDEVIDPKYIVPGPGGDENEVDDAFSSLFDSTPTSLDYSVKAPVITGGSISLNADASASVSVGFGGVSLLQSPGQFLTDASVALIQYIGKGAGLSALTSSIASSISVGVSLKKFHDRAFDVFKFGLDNFETLDAAKYNQMVDGLFRDARGEFLGALGGVTGVQTDGPAARFIKGINLTVGPLNAEVRLEASIGIEGVPDLLYSALPSTLAASLPTNGGISIIGETSSGIFGSETRELVINLDASTETQEDDRFELYGGDDGFFGGDREEDVFLGSGNDTAFSGGGNDDLFGEDGIDVLYGEAGDDDLWGDAGNDQLFGGIGNDELFGGLDDDVVFGGSGNDTLDGGGENDLLGGGLGRDELIGGLGRDSLWGAGDNDTLSGNDGHDQAGGGAGDDQIFGGVGNDSVWGGDGNDTQDGGAGDDEVWGYFGNNRLIGGSGNDQLGGRGNDTITGGTGRDTIFAADGDDSVDGGEDSDTIYGGRGADTVSAGAGNDLIFASVGNDSVDGGAGDDTVFVGAGQDTVTGGAGNDEIHLAGANNTVLFSSGQDTVIGFSTTGSVLDFNAAPAITDFADLLANHVTQPTSSDVIIDDGSGNKTKLTGIALGQLVEANFRFLDVAPVANDDIATIVQGKVANIDLLLNDDPGDGDRLSVLQVDPAPNGTVELVNDAILYTPDTGFVGTDEFAYTIGDGNGNIATANVAVTVEPAPTPDIPSDLTTTAVSLGQTRSLLEASGDVDWFRIDLNSSGFSRLYISPVIDFAAAPIDFAASQIPITDLSFQLYNERGTAIYDLGTFETFGSLNNPETLAVSLNQGSFRRVGSFDDVAYLGISSDAGEVGDYVFQTFIRDTETDRGGAVLSEGVDRPETPLSSGFNLIAGPNGTYERYAGSTDGFFGADYFDYFRFSVTEAQNVEFIVRGTHSIDLDGPYSYWDGDNGRITADLEPGIYDLSVSSVLGGNYTLEIYW